MTKRNSYLALAEKMYVIEHKSIESIATDLNLNFKTILRWKNEGEWEEKRKSYIQNQQMFHEELYVYSRKLMHSLQEDLDSNKKSDTAKMYTFTRILPLITKIKEYEDIATAKGEENSERKSLTVDELRQIEELLGIRSYDDEQQDELEKPEEPDNEKNKQ